jgi:ABC-type transport system involved in cytochrome c biogenesis ATPase subunit
MDVVAARALKTGRGRRIVLTGVDRTLQGGAVVHVAGENGSGKTSLLRVLAGLGCLALAAPAFAAAALRSRRA